MKQARGMFHQHYYQLKQLRKIAFANNIFAFAK